MRAIYADKHIPRVLLTKAIAPLWPGFVWTPLSSARAGELPDPPLPGPHWLRVKNLQCGICASDLSLLFVHANPSIAPAALPGLSRFWLGHETVSAVTEVGPSVTRFRLGDRVIMDTHFEGANCLTLEIEPHCRYCVEGQHQLCINKSEPGPRGQGGGFGDSFVTHESALYPVPPSLTHDQAVIAEPLSMAMHAVLRAAPMPGDKVLIIGAGIMGLLVTMAVRALFPEAQITVLARYPHQQEMAQKLGANHILQRANYSEIARLSGGKYFTGPLNKGVVIGGFDRIYDCVANPETVNNSLRWTRAGGTVVMVGAHMAPMPKVDLTPLWYQQVDLIGSYGRAIEEWQGEDRHTYELVFDQFRQGKFDIDGLITHRFPMRDYKEGIRVATSKAKEKSIKVEFLHET